MASEKQATKQTQRDPELLALHRIIREMTSLPMAARKRIAGYLVNRNESDELAETMPRQEIRVDE